MRKALLLAALVAATAGRGAAADEVVLRNGDRLSGTLLHVADGKLALRTPYAESLELDWGEIAQIRTDAPVTVLRRGEARPTLLRLTPLAMWARTEPTPVTPPKVGAPEPQTAADELRHLMANLGVPPHVAGVSYGRGCRIRRVRVPGGKERRRADAPGPVILSKRALDRQREANQ